MQYPTNNIMFNTMMKNNTILKINFNDIDNNNYIEDAEKNYCKLYLLIAEGVKVYSPYYKEDIVELVEDCIIVNGIKGKNYLGVFNTTYDFKIHNECIRNIINGVIGCMEYKNKSFPNFKDSYESCVMKKMALGYDDTSNETRQHFLFGVFLYRMFFEFVYYEYNGLYKNMLKKNKK